MRAVWKFHVPLAGTAGDGLCHIDAPTNLRPVLVAQQGDSLCLWAEVDPNLPYRQHDFVWFGTGHQIPYSDPPTGRGYEHVGSLLDGPFVWHLYMLVEPF